MILFWERWPGKKTEKYNARSKMQSTCCSLGARCCVCLFSLWDTRKQHRLSAAYVRVSWATAASGLAVIRSLSIFVRLKADSPHTLSLSDLSLARVTRFLFLSLRPSHPVIIWTSAYCILLHFPHKRLHKTQPWGVFIAQRLMFQLKRLYALMLYDFFFKVLSFTHIQNHIQQHVSIHY